nr:MAG TPA: hypothetical protein [Caudoviricetes sp.]
MFRIRHTFCRLLRLRPKTTTESSGHLLRSMVKLSENI